MRRSFLVTPRALALGLALVITAPVLAEDDAPPADKDQIEAIERTVRDALSAVLRKLQDMIETIPKYEAPEILDNGDIIIRRIHPKIIDDERNRPYPAANRDQDSLIGGPEAASS